MAGAHVDNPLFLSKFPLGNYNCSGNLLGRPEGLFERTIFSQALDKNAGRRVICSGARTNVTME